MPHSQLVDNQLTRKFVPAKPSGIGTTIVSIRYSALSPSDAVGLSPFDAVGLSPFDIIRLYLSHYIAHGQKKLKINLRNRTIALMFATE
jgi:hypothetical protein